MAEFLQPPSAPELPTRLTLACPLCRAPLVRAPKTWACPERHSFDVAREGYVNLLPVQHKKSLSPGDTAESVAARRRFLAAGHYQPLRDAVATLLRGLQPQVLAAAAEGGAHGAAALDLLVLVVGA